MAGVKDPCIDKGRPLQVISVNDKGITLNKEELSELLERDDVKDSPLAVISVAGLCRTGKSFLLNFMLRYLREDGQKDWIGTKDEDLEGFPWRQGVDPTTRGISMWSKPFHKVSKDGKQMVIILMDTEGLFDSSQTTDDISAVFALSALISSTQVFNVLNKIEEPHLKQLELFLEISRMILALVRRERSDESFQRFVWLIRDWIDNAKYEYGERGGQKYLNATFKAEGQPTELRKLGNRLESSFQKSDCYLMPHPGLSAVSTYSREESFYSMDEEDSYPSTDSETEFTGQLRKLPSKFRKHLKRLMPYLLDPGHLSVKTIGGIEMNGKTLLDNIERYASVLNSRQLPKISSPREDFVRHFDSLLVIDLLKMHGIYVNKLSEKMKDMPFIYREEWETDISAQEEELRNNFMKIASGGPDFKKKKSDELERLLSSRRRDLCELFNNLNSEKLQRDHQERTTKIRHDMTKWQTLTTDKVEQAIRTEEKRTKNILEKLTCGDSKQKQQLHQDVQRFFISTRVDINEDFNNLIIENILEDHQNRIDLLSDKMKNMPFIYREEWETDISAQEQEIRNNFMKIARGGPEIKKKRTDGLERPFSSHKRDLCELFNNLNAEKLQRDHQERATKVRQNMKKWQTLTSEKVEEAIRTEEQRTKNILEKLTCGDSKQKQHLDQDVQCFLISTRVDIDEAFNNLIIENILEDHLNRIQQIAVSYKYKNRIPPSNVIETALKNEEEKTKTLITKTLRGNSKDKNTFIQHIEFYRKGVYDSINRLIFKDVLGYHRERAEKLYNSNNSWRLLTDATSNLKDDIEKEEQYTRQSFHTQAVGDSTDSEPFSFSLKTDLERWRIETLEDLKRKEETWNEAKKILGYFNQNKQILEHYHAKVKSCKDKTLECSTGLRRIAGQVKNSLDIAHALGFAAPSSTAAATILAFSFALLPIVLFCILCVVLAEWGCLLGCFLEFSYQKKEAKQLLEDWKVNFKDTLNVTLGVIDTVDQKSKGFNRYKMLNILLSATAADTPLEKFCIKAMPYLMDPTVRPQMYIDGKENEVLAKKKKDLKYNINRLIEQVGHGSWSFGETDFSRSHLQSFPKKMTDIYQELLKINSSLTKLPCN